MVLKMLAVRSEHGLKNRQPKAYVARLVVMMTHTSKMGPLLAHVQPAGQGQLNLLS